MYSKYHVRMFEYSVATPRVTQCTKGFVQAWWMGHLKSTLASSKARQDYKDMHQGEDSVL
jgi:hypothetical protein